MLQSVQLHQVVFGNDADVPVLLSDPPAVGLILLQARQGFRHLFVCLCILMHEQTKKKHSFIHAVLAQHRHT